MIKIDNNIKINAPIEEGLEFFNNLNKNYELIDPQHHIQCKYIQGTPFQEGAILYFEEELAGKYSKIKCEVEKVVPQKKIVCKYLFPQSLLGVKMIFNIEDKNNGFILTETIQIGYDIFLLGTILDFIVLSFVKLLLGQIEILKEHQIKGLQNIKKLIEDN